jgi:Flp pilus assembly protein CpaB
MASVGRTRWVGWLLAGLGLACGCARQQPSATKAAPPVELVKVPVAARDLLAGEVLRPADLETVERPKHLVAADPRLAAAVKDSARLLSATLREPVKQGEPFAPGQLKPPPASVAETVRPGFLAVALPVPDKVPQCDLACLAPDMRVKVICVTADGGTRILAPDAGVLAVGDVFDAVREEQRRAAIRGKIDDVRAQKQKKSTQPGNPPDWWKAYDERIAALQALADRSSVTLELTPDEARRVAVERQRDGTRFVLALRGASAGQPTEAR